MEEDFSLVCQRTDDGDGDGDCDDGACVALFRIIFRPLASKPSCT